MDNLVVFDNGAFAAFHKPKGLPTSRLRGQTAPCLLDLAIRRRPRIAGLPGRQPHEPGLLHRLDIGTSGLVLVALTAGAFFRLSEIQDAGLMRKFYSARTVSCPPDRTWPPLEAVPCGGAILLRSFFRPYGPGRRAVRPCARDAREASPRLCETRVTALGDGVYSCSIDRGFRHQIRAHLAWMGRPVEGDGLYGPAEGPLMLECQKIVLPWEGQRLEIELPQELRQF